MNCVLDNLSHPLQQAASLHSMNPTSTVHQVLQFFSFTLGAKKGQCRLPFRLPVIPFFSVTSSLHPSSHPTALPEFCWDCGCTGSGDRQRRQREKTKPQPCAELISHNPPTLDPAVSSHSPLRRFLFSAFLTTSSYFSFLSLSSIPAASCPTPLTDWRTVLGNDHV